MLSVDFHLRRVEISSMVLLELLCLMGEWPDVLGAMRHVFDSAYAFISLLDAKTFILCVQQAMPLVPFRL